MWYTQPAVGFSSTEQLFWSNQSYLRVAAVPLLIFLPDYFYFNLCHWGKQLVVLSVPWQFRFLFHTLLALFSHFCLLWLAVVINQCLVNLPCILSEAPAPSCTLTVWSSFFILTRWVLLACRMNQLFSPVWGGRMNGETKPKQNSLYRVQNSPAFLQCFSTSFPL